MTNERRSREVRNWLMLGFALVMTVYEATITTEPRPFLLTLYASMMGLPLLLRGDGGSK